MERLKVAVDAWKSTYLKTMIAHKNLAGRWEVHLRNRKNYVYVLKAQRNMAYEHHAQTILEQIFFYYINALLK